MRIRRGFNIATRLAGRGAVPTRSTVVRFLVGLLIMLFLGVTARPDELTPSYIPNETIVLSRFGVYPLAITRQKGPFYLFLLNRNWDREETAQVVRPGGAAVSGSTSSFQTSAAKTFAGILLDLPVGTYEIHFKKQPDAVVAITITN